MNLDLVNKIKRLAIIALASDDQLIESIVLKGGNAIDLAYHDSSSISRTSYDLDFSIEDGDFEEDVAVISERIHKTLVQTFGEHGFALIDYKFNNRPKTPTIEFWSGYQVTFKVLDQKIFNDNKDNISNQRRLAIPLKPGRSSTGPSPTFELEFSKFEYVGSKAAIDVDGFTVYVYTPEMIVFEKLRAICQQLPQYKGVIKSFSARPRARDFYDIHLIMEMHQLDANSNKNKELIAKIFGAKQVPLGFIKEISTNKEFHKDNWDSVKDTVSKFEKSESFDFYFDYVVNTFQPLTFP
ncbi:nucleotidyl transferase AbiEii/AbiGii toxin family protein [Adhaeribacter pallidiroseus]|uniref:Nucleotidyl transferase AbiEii/AbiGii toxin family protein n=1 Tax=Adhaeribacter pallidiroseus TaxID=2072847 RepID=A0A369Q6I6_9BACT|nr:nucleotidyl transferase AbiEii/AbiGii toxin family protein [Adhaeribacter pallidiroseus]RDC58683.1 hypothetical protein AHMF7616_05317 [Adhaeribacter pallidiroseus]RDC58726.1 hypothetical protein AHMF7616_05360 [Adhaeribacter pallidiroseus]